MKMNFGKLKMKLDAFNKKASELVNDKSKTLSKIEEGLKIASANKGALSDVWSQLLLLFSLTKDYAKGSYVDIPKTTIVSVLAALLYFISPIDLVPDFIVGMGFLDDAFVLGFVYKRVSKELLKYQVWKKIEDEKQKNTIEISS
ncbi:YkvA family protein [Pedobacter sp. UBA4863]|uniref:YkvA family protein n=1 Tax=Pedobacter sp. UBA4863 TaxID=1947060 RepID=UPI0025FDA318|nr:YkvA family protein [Pedobacter sp. UBA4863]